MEHFLLLCFVMAADPHVHTDCSPPCSHTFESLTQETGREAADGYCSRLYTAMILRHLSLTSSHLWRRFLRRINGLGGMDKKTCHCSGDTNAVSLCIGCPTGLGRCMTCKPGDSNTRHGPPTFVRSCEERRRAEMVITSGLTVYKHTPRKSQGLFIGWELRSFRFTLVFTIVQRVQNWWITE